MKKIYYIMGKSATGKDHIYRALLEEERLSLRKLVIYTTRPKREGEEDGKEYFFVSEEERRKLEERGKIIEQRDYETVHGLWSYFTADDGQVDLAASAYIGIGTLESYEKLCSHYGRERVSPLYIESEDSERLLRAIKREKKQKVPKYEEVCRRFLADQEDFTEEKLSQAGITRRFLNEDLEACIRELVTYLAAE